MKILYLANIRIPTEKAHGYQISKMCESFASLDNQVLLLLPNRSNKDFSQTNLFDYYKVKKNFEAKKIKTFDPRWALKLPKGYYIKLQSIFFVTSLFFYFIFHKRYWDISYTRDEYLLPLMQMFSKKTVWESHALPNRKSFYLKYFKKCHKILVLTEKLKQDLIDMGIDEGEIMVSPSAVDIDTFDININTEQARAKLSLAQDKKIIGYTGNFKTKGMDKGISDILKAIKLLPDNILFVAVGGSEEDIDYYHAMAKAEGVDNKLLFIGKVDHSKLALYQKAFDLLLMPFPNKKHYAYFMSPLKMFEYMAAKKPIIASDLPSIRDVLDENSCLFCRPDDPSDLAEKIKIVLGDKLLQYSLSKEAYKKSLNYSWEVRAKKIFDFICL